MRKTASSAPGPQLEALAALGEGHLRVRHPASPGRGRGRSGDSAAAGSRAPPPAPPSARGGGRRARPARAVSSAAAERAAASGSVRPRSRMPSGLDDEARDGGHGDVLKLAHDAEPARLLGELQLPVDTVPLGLATIARAGAGAPTGHAARAPGRRRQRRAARRATITSSMSGPRGPSRTVQSWSSLRAAVRERPGRSYRAASRAQDAARAGSREAPRGGRGTRPRRCRPGRTAPRASARPSGWTRPIP